jgi:hypothetical protein
MRRGCRIACQGCCLSIQMRSNVDGGTRDDGHVPLLARPDNTIARFALR